MYVSWAQLQQYELNRHSDEWSRRIRGREKFSDITTAFFQSQGDLPWWFQCALLFILTWFQPQRSSDSGFLSDWSGRSSWEMLHWSLFNLGSDDGFVFQSSKCLLEYSDCAAVCFWRKVVASISPNVRKTVNQRQYTTITRVYEWYVWCLRRVICKSLCPYLLKFWGSNPWFSAFKSLFYLYLLYIKAYEVMKRT